MLNIVVVTCILSYFSIANVTLKLNYLYSDKFNTISSATFLTGFVKTRIPSKPAK